MTETLLVELFTEELPPKALKQLGDAFATELHKQLARRDLLDSGSSLTWFATPRRLAVRISEVRDKSPDRSFDEKLVPAKVGFNKNGKPTPALLKKLTAVGRDESVVSDIVRRDDGKIEMLYLPSVAAGQSIQDALEEALGEAIDRLPIPKAMTYQVAGGMESVKFVRPAHGLVALWGSKVLPVKALGLVASNVTHGHRFLGEHDIALAHADDYEKALRDKGKVIASFDARRSVIENQLQSKANELGNTLHHDDALLDEVTALVEWPVVYAADFDKEFLSVPQECLILTMRTNQRYFPLFDSEGSLTERFLLVSNMEVADPTNIVDGNRRVVRPRLADAQFFYDTDQKSKLETLVPKLGNVIYHNRLGTQLERVQRIRKLAGSIAEQLGTDVDAAERAAWLCKADLMSEMVGEFPELQGVMGRYYALHDGENAKVADAIEQHYRPRFSNDAVPEDNVAASVALADKIDTLVGIFGIGLVPTGEKDPFALRRQALGVLRILIEKQLPLDLMHLLELAHAQFPREMLADSVAVDLHGFMLDRLRGYLREHDYSADEIEAVLSQWPTRIDLVMPRIAAVREFRQLPEAESLSAANKRIRNILKKAHDVGTAPELALLQEPAEKNLFGTVNKLLPQVTSLVEAEDYADALKLLAGVRTEVDTFFDEVMVMTEEPMTRNNRLALLAQLEQLMNRVADISKLAA
ncbi:MAG: glycine--tRNA ligase subunit beta [Betaproteobacteria bacterium]|nr:MAG: glycine--tRNA ligase subunit beta [Betaproteobacteria bacterium]